MTDEAARGAFDWIESVGVATAAGTVWLEDGERVDHLYSGTAGVLLGCAEATAAGLSAKALARVAAGARDRLVHLAGDEPAAEMVEGDGLFDGWAGVAVALRAWALVSGDRTARDAAGSVAARVAERRPASPAGWPGSPRPEPPRCCPGCDAAPAVTPPRL